MRSFWAWCAFRSSRRARHAASVAAATSGCAASIGKPLGAVAITLLGAVYTGGTLSFVYALRYFGYAVGMPRERSW